MNTEGDVRRVTTDFPKYPDQLKDPPLAARADRRRAAPTRRAGARRTSTPTTTSRRRAISSPKKRTTSPAKSRGRPSTSSRRKSATQCDVDVGPAVASSLREAVDKQLEKRLRAHNDAHVLIDRYRETLGKANAAALEKQADDISAASYATFIRSVELKVRATRLLDEASQMRKTLDQAHRRRARLPGRAGSQSGGQEGVERAHRENGRRQSPHRCGGSPAPEPRQGDRPAQPGDEKEYKDAFEALKKAIAAKSVEVTRGLVAAVA